MELAADAPTDEAHVRWALPLSTLRATDRAGVGGKAATLGELLAAGFPVPDGFAVPAAAHRRWRAVASLPDEAWAEIEAAAAALGDDPLAVRSSGVDEDGAVTSFAGQFESVLGVRVGELRSAILRCWASADAERVTAYRTHGAPEEAAPQVLAVLVQRLVPAEAAGVALTADPVTGDRDTVVISAVRGLGERLVSGEADADEWAVTSAGAAPRRVRGVLDAPAAREIAALARRVADRFGEPQDIEWACRNGRTWLVQARPITALPDPVRWEAPPGGWGRQLRLGEWIGDPVTPLFESWLLTRIERRMYANYDAIGGSGPAPEPLHAIVNGWYYQSFDLLPKTPWAALRFLARFGWKLLTNPRRTVMVVPPLTHLGVDAMVSEWREQLAPAYARAVAEGERTVDGLDRAGLVALIDTLGDHVGDAFTSISFVAGHAWKCEVALAKLFRTRLAGKVEGTHAELLAGLYVPGGVTHAVYGLDWFHPTGSTHPTTGLQHLARRRQELEAACRAALAGRARERFDGLLARAQRFAAIREEQTAGLTLAWPLLRRAVLRLGADLARRGVLTEAEEVWFLHRDELDATAPIATAARRGLWVRQRRLAAPLYLGQVPAPIKRVIDESQGLFRGTAPTGAIQGLGASPGRVTAIARVVRTPAEFDRLGEGEVLVTPATTPAWTPLFSRAAAVVTDTGSPLAHASLVAREFGIPAVVGTGDATTRIADGARVTVDGVRGVVEVA